MHKLIKVPQLGRREKARAIHVLSLIVLSFLHAEGIVAFSTGIWLIERVKRTSCDFLNQFIAASVFWIVSGFLCILVSIPGVLTTVKNRQYLRPPYFVGGFIIIIILEITVAVVSTLDYRNLSGKFQSQLLNSISASAHRECWENLQSDFECCGATSYENWITKPELSVNTSLWAISSCQCNDETTRCTNVSNSLGLNLAHSNVWSDTCYEKVFAHIALQCNFLRIFCPIMAISQMFAGIFLGYVFKKILVNNTVQIIKEKYMVQFSSQTTLCDNAKRSSHRSIDGASSYI